VCVTVCKFLFVFVIAGVHLGVMFSVYNITKRVA